MPKVGGCRSAAEGENLEENFLLKRPKSAISLRIRRVKTRYLRHSTLHPAECGGSFVGRGLRRSFRSLRKAATVYKPVHQCKLLAGVATLEYSMKPASTYAHSSPCTNRPVTCTKCGFIFHDLVVLNEGPLERQARRRGAADYARAGGGVALPREGGHGAAPLQALREERQGCVPRKDQPVHACKTSPFVMD